MDSKFYKTHHFITGPFQPHHIFLGDDEYSRALDCLVKACTDILLYDETSNKILVGKRKVEPQPDWWFVGGRMKPGERVEESASRLLKRELAINIDPNRFQTIGHYSFVWARRQQPPMDHGTADISIVLTANLTLEEIKNIKQDPTEYDELMWVSPDAIVDGNLKELDKNLDIQFHPALRRSTCDFICMNMWRKIEKSTKDSNASDSDIRKLLSQYLDQKNKV